MHKLPFFFVLAAKLFFCMVLTYTLKTHAHTMINSTKGSTTKCRAPSPPCLHPQLPPQKQLLSPRMQLSGGLYASADTSELPYAVGTATLCPLVPFGICFEQCSIPCVHISSCPWSFLSRDTGQECSTLGGSRTWLHCHHWPPAGPRQIAWPLSFGFLIHNTRRMVPLLMGCCDD